MSANLWHCDALVVQMELANAELPSLIEKFKKYFKLGNI